MSSFSKKIDRACKPKSSLPNSEVIDSILLWTSIDPKGLCVPLLAKLRGRNYYVVLKALTLLHLMIEATPMDHALSLIAPDLDLLPSNKMTNNELQDTPILRAPKNRKSRLVPTYKSYLEGRLAAYRELNQDIVNAESHPITLLHNKKGSHPKSDRNTNSSGTLSRRGAGSRKNVITIIPIKSRTLEQGLLNVLVVLKKQMEDLFDCTNEIEEAGGTDIGRMVLSLWLKNLMVLIEAYYHGLCNATERYSHMVDAEAEVTAELRIDFSKKADQVNTCVKAFKIPCSTAVLRKISVPFPNLPYRPPVNSKLGSRTGEIWPLTEEFPLPLPPGNSTVVVDEESFTFINTDICFQPGDVGLTGTVRFQTFAANETIILTLGSKTMLYKPSLKKLHQLSHSQETVNPDAACCATLSPCGKFLVRRLNSGNLTQAINVETSQIIHTSASLLTCGPLDFLSSVWKDYTLFVPCLKKGYVIIWNLREKTVGNKRFQPLSAVMGHQVLEFCCSTDNKWWVAIGRSLNEDKWNGTIEVYNTKSEESRVVDGATCCIAEVEIYDHIAPLMVVVDTKQGNKLSLSVTQIEVKPEHRKFIPVDVCVQYFVADDSPVRVTVFDGLPIVVVTTHKMSLYFFELHTGASLHSHHHLNLILPASIDNRSVINQRPDHTLERISVNEFDLIGWVRRVLKDDTLASSIAIRTGLPGADDVLVDAMHGTYHGVESARVI